MTHRPRSCLPQTQHRARSSTKTTCTTILLRQYSCVDLQLYRHTRAPKPLSFSCFLAIPLIAVMQKQIYRPRPRNWQRKVEATHPAPKGLGYLPSSRPWIVKRLQYSSNLNKHLASHLSHGGPESFWGFEPATLDLLRAPNSVRCRVDPKSIAPTVTKEGSSYRLHTPPAVREKIKEVTLQTCRIRPDTPIKVHAAGSRTRAHLAEHQRWVHTSVFCRSDDSDCMRAALINAINIFSRADAEHLLSLGPIRDDRFSTVNTWMERHFPRYSLCHCQIGTLRPDDWVMRQSEGVFLLIISGSDSYGDDSEHVVVIDCAGQAIIDCCEPHTLKMEWSVLRRCVGNATYRGGIDVRRLHRHDVGTGNRKDRRKRKQTANQIERKKQHRVEARHLQIHRALVGTIPKIN